MALGLLAPVHHALSLERIMHCEQTWTSRFAASNRRESVDAARRRITRRDGFL
jgi:hypothetical protein